MPKALLALLGPLLILLMVGCGDSSEKAAPSEATPEANIIKPTPQVKTIAVGAWVPEVPWSYGQLEAQERQAGRTNDIVNLFISWDDLQDPIEPAILDPIYRQGSIAMITWQPNDYRGGTDQPAFSLAEIASGRYDDYIEKWARMLASTGRPVLLRFAHEMNGSWFSWGVNVNGNTPEKYIAAWRHVHQVFDRAKATNVKWIWCPNIDNADPALFYPGDDYVDWLGLVGFNNADWGLWRSFTEIFAPTYARITSISTKPVMIAEVGTTEASADVPGDKATWISNMYMREIPRDFPGVQAVVWFDEDKRYYGEGDYRIDSSPEALAAYKVAVGSRLYSGTTRVARP